jgi:hypothetical protein
MRPADHLLIFGSCDELALLELGAGADQGDEMALPARPAG